MKHKVGDKVVIREDLSPKFYKTENGGDEGVTILMLDYAGKTAVIESIFEGSYKIDLDCETYYWTSTMFEEDKRVSLPKDVAIEIKNAKRHNESFIYMVQFNCDDYPATLSYIYQGNPSKFTSFSIDKVLDVANAYKYGCIVEESPKEVLVKEYNKNKESEFSKGVLQALDVAGISIEGINGEAVLDDFGFFADTI